LTFDLLTSV